MVGSSYAVVGAARIAAARLANHPTIAWGTGPIYQPRRTAPDSIGSKPAVGDFDADACATSEFLVDAQAQLARLPAKQERDQAERAAAEALLAAARDARER